MNMATLSNKSNKNAFDEEPWSELNSLLYSCWLSLLANLTFSLLLDGNQASRWTPVWVIRIAYSTQEWNLWDLVTKPDALPLSYKTLVGDKATKLL